MNTSNSRRRFLHGVLALATLAVLPIKLLARNREAFHAENAADAMAAIFGDKPVSESAEVKLKVPDIAEDGSVVPISISTDISGVRSISLIVDENPNPLSARFSFMPGAVSDISTRIKMGDSSIVRAAVETDDAVYVAQKAVKVTLGGCGG